MLHTYQLPFVLSEWLWNNIAATNIFGKQKGIENWFYIDAKTLDDYISSKLDKFFTSNQLEIFGKVWGLDFVFEFLHQQQLLSAEYYEKMKENITYCKLKMIRFVCGDLWQMTFIFNWPRTSNYIDDPSEESVFNSTFGADFQKSTEIINQYLSDFEIPSRIKKELKVSNSKPIIPPSIWPETQPVKKGQKIGRNDLCPCGSGKKYKKCCLK
ncbi:MAG: SEC-C domain-containing protein [Cryomorphaceae bacterium]|nr:SEC-C domain-containing protein [Cryomorphaceae bacterium]